MYYTGCRGKEGLRKLSKNSFKVKKSPNGEEFIEITFNEKTKKNQGDSMSAKANALHNDHHVITEIPGSPLCPVQSFKMYLDLLNPDSTAFFQYPNKRKTAFTKEVIGKNPLGDMMKEISTQAKLSRSYTNHQIRKTTATGIKRSGFTLEQIAHVTKHKNLDSLKHYVDAPTLSEKQSYNEGLFNYGTKKMSKNPKRSQDEDPQPPKRMAITSGKENMEENFPKDREMVVQNKNCNTQQGVVPAQDNCTDLHSVVNNQLRQAPNLFQNATFSNCNFNFTLPQ